MAAFRYMRGCWDESNYFASRKWRRFLLYQSHQIPKRLGYFKLEVMDALRVSESTQQQMNFRRLRMLIFAQVYREVSARLPALSYRQLLLNAPAEKAFSCLTPPPRLLFDFSCTLPLYLMITTRVLAWTNVDNGPKCTSSEDIEE